MNVIHLFESDRQSYWIEEIGKSDWSAGGLLYGLLKDGDFFKWVGEGSEVLLLVQGDTLISYCTFAKMDDIQPTDLSPWVGFVYTFPAYRGRRCVGLLFAEADRLARRAHISEVYVSTNHIGLYEKYGCTFLKTAKDLEGEWSRIYVRRVQDSDAVPQDAALPDASHQD